MRVLVTRPEPGASRTAEKLRALGHEPVLLPLTRIAALAPEWPAGKFEAVLATSANALLSASTLPEQWKALPVHTVGQRTADAARNAGFLKAGIVAADANALLAQLSGTCARGSRIAYLCGKVRRPDIEQGLAARGQFVTPTECYDTLSVSYLTDNVDEIFDFRPVDCCLVMSGETADGLVPLLREPQLGHLFEKTQYYCISGRVAESLEPFARGSVHVAETPDEAGLLRLLTEGKA